MRPVVNQPDIDVDDTLMFGVDAVDTAIVIVSLFNVVVATNESLAIRSQAIVKFGKSYSSIDVIVTTRFVLKLKIVGENFHAH